MEVDITLPDQKCNLAAIKIIVLTLWTLEKKHSLHCYTLRSDNRKSFDLVV